ncbi:hypothetical protein SLH49_09190 [Cognatiyoonia sp. IB215446]|uniref:hypothetical protein n=1 Tax=Cognatiyoonia sp. IB215446 TaxID=3097355 RepID=UPI002A151A92|nr:hypothetical protein [Cognatiyoonia sp. IB215446]MDX8348160.1 hypothetical protein [Cognatiyoonia sp. IB215446]
MNEDYEYRRAPNRGVIWLSVAAVILLIVATTLTGSEELSWLVWALGSLTLCWMLMPKPVAGIRIDNEYLVLSAWRQPRAIKLDDIAYLRVTEASAETYLAIVYKDGTEEGVFAGDLPDLETLAEVLAARGIAVRDRY